MSKLFEHRYLFVPHRLTADQKTTLQRITRRVGTLAPLAADHGGGLPIVRPPLPDGDGAGSTGSATGTREPVQAAGPGSGRRSRVGTRKNRGFERDSDIRKTGVLLLSMITKVACFPGFQGVNAYSSPNLEKALTFLDDKLLPATSNAVERSNRCYRKAQKSIYSVRTAEHIRQRIALDMQPDQQAPDCAQTTKALASGPFWDEKTPRMMLQSPQREEKGGGRKRKGGRERVEKKEIKGVDCPGASDVTKTGRGSSLEWRSEKELEGMQGVLTDHLGRSAHSQFRLEPAGGKLQGVSTSSREVSRSGSRIPVVSTRQSIARAASNSSSSRVHKAAPLEGSR